MSRVPLKTVSGRLGHSSTAFTQDRYGHILAIMEDEAAAAMEESYPTREARTIVSAVANDRPVSGDFDFPRFSPNEGTWDSLPGPKPA